MNPQMMMGGGDNGINLLNIIINIAFGFVVGLVVFLGFEAVLAYGEKLAADLIKLSGYGQQMAMFGIATTAAPYIIIAPILGLVAKQLAAVRSIKTFLFFIVAVAIGFVVAFFAIPLLSIPA